MKINVYSEIKPLKKVLLHRPGGELLNLTPDSLERLLFDDIPFLEKAQKEHDYFAEVLKNNGVEVFYLENLAAEAISTSPEVKDKFVRQFIKEAGITSNKYKKTVYDYLISYTDNLDLILKCMEGIRLNELYSMKRDIEHSLVDFVSEEGKFLADPMPNLIFTRDNFASIGHGISLNKMYSVTRNRETIFAEYIFNYHPDYACNVVKYYDRSNPYHIEGGDILVLSDHILAIGISQRTMPEAIEQLAHNLFKDENCKFDTILAFSIPKSRAFMHLDTVFTQIDVDKFSYHPGIMEKLQVFEITEGHKDEINVKEMKDSLQHILSRYLNRDVTLIPCGAGDKIISEREQWNDGSNTLCIAPGVVVVYDRNNVTNEILKRAGIKVIEIEGSELSRGRGGPRCMSMPLDREN